VGYEIVVNARCGWSGEQSKNIARILGDPANGNLIVWKGSAARAAGAVTSVGVENLAAWNATYGWPKGVQIFAEVAKPWRRAGSVRRGIAGLDCRGGRDCVQVGDTGGLLGSLIVAEEEKLVLDDGTTARTAKLLPSRRRECNAGFVGKRIARL